LRYKIREVADNVLSNYISLDAINNSIPGFIRVSQAGEEKNLIFLLRKDLEILKGYFNVAKWQNWVSYFDILEIEEKYDSIYTKFTDEIERQKKPEEEIVFIPDMPKISEVLPITSVSEIEPKKKSSLDDRKGKIIEILGQKEKVQVWEVNKVFPDVSKRTIRRDFVELLKQGLIERIGERSETFYKLKSIES